MRETPLYQGEQYKEAARPAAALPRLSLPQDPFASALPNAVEQIKSAMFQYAEIKDYQKQMESARARKENEMGLKKELRRRMDLPWGSDGSMYLHDGSINEDAVRGLVAEYQERNLSTRGDLWLRKNNIRDKEGLKTENQMLDFDAWEIIGAKERQNIERSAVDTYNAMVSSNDFNGARTATLSAVERGVWTPQYGVSKMQEVADREHDANQESLIGKANGFIAEGRRDELVDAWQNGEFDDLDAVARINLGKRINAMFGKPYREKVKGSNGKENAVMRAPDGLPQYVADAFDLRQQKGDALSMDERTGIRAALVRYARATKQGVDSAEEDARIREVGRMCRIDDNFVKETIKTLDSEMNGAGGKVNIPGYLKIIKTGRPLLPDAQIDLRRSLMQEEASWRQRLASDKGVYDNEDKKREVKAELDRIKMGLDYIERCETYNEDQLGARLQVRYQQELTNDPDADYDYLMACMNDETDKYMKSEAVNINAGANPYLGKMKETVSLSQERRAAVLSERQSEGEASKEDVVQDAQREAEKPKRPEVKTYSVPKAIDATLPAALYVPKGSAKGAKTVKVFNRAGNREAVLPVIEADVQELALSRRAHEKLGNALQTLESLRMMGNVAFLETSEESRDEVMLQEYSTDDGLLPVNMLFPEGDDEPGYITESEMPTEELGF